MAERKKDMRQFEIGKRYQDGAITFEITGRTKTTIKFVVIQHVNKPNERKSSEKRTKILDWGDREVFMVNERTIEA